MNLVQFEQNKYWYNLRMIRNNPVFKEADARFTTVPLNRIRAKLLEVIFLLFYLKIDKFPVLVFLPGGFM